MLETSWYSALMSLVTIYCLVGDDIRLAYFAKSSDLGFFIVALLCFILFAIEFTLCCYAKPGYIRSFYFYLDIIATISLIPDIGFVWDAVRIYRRVFLSISIDVCSTIYLQKN